MSKKNFGIGAKGIVLIAVLAAAAIGIAGYLFSRNSVQEVTMQEPMIDNMAVSTHEPLSVTESATIPTASSLPQVKTSEPVQDTTPQPSVTQTTEAPVKKTFTTTSPVSGDTIGDYAMDCLSYNETTRDWRTHNGIDLAAGDGAPVCAAADGTVYTTYEDDTMGFTVVIRHDGGYTTRYSSLKEELAVKPGDAVTMGQTIGYAGDTALIETVMGSHVHFSVSYQDQDMDPAEFFAMS